MNAFGRINSRRFCAIITTAVLLAVSFSVQALVTQPARAAGAQSPTGRNPRLFWTPERQAVWNQMVTDYNANPSSPATEGGQNFKIIKDKADSTSIYADSGQWAVLVYQMTGNAAYAQNAFTKFKAARNDLALVSPGSGNDTRQDFEQDVQMYDWLYPSLIQDQRVAFVNYLNYIGDLTLDKVPNLHWGTAIGDSDEDVGHYFGDAFIALATGANPNYPNDYVNPRAWEFVNDPHMGGLSATGNDFSSVRNAIKQFVVKLADGGEWIESSDYNVNTLQLLMMGYEGVKTASGTDYFPEVTAYLPHAAQAMISEVAPDLKASFQWGDEEHARDIHLWGRGPAVSMMAGLLQENNDTTWGPATQGFLHDLVAANPGVNNALPTSLPTYFYFYNPYAASNANWRTLIGNTFSSPGQGLFYARNGWSAADSFLGVHFPTSIDVQHWVPYFGDFQLYRNGKWAVTHVLGYADGPEDQNTMMFSGYSGALEGRGPDVSEGGTGYSYAAGSTGGSLWQPGYYYAPGTFIHEWTRSFLYLPSSDKKLDTVVIFDRANVKDPKTLSDWATTDANGKTCDQGASLVGQYRCADWTKVNTSPVKSWNIHMPTMPTLSGNRMTWQTCDGQSIALTTLEPSVSSTLYRESARTRDGPVNTPDKDCLNNTTSGTVLDEMATVPSELHLQARLMPTVNKQWDTFLNVVQAADAPVTASNTLVKSLNDEAEGALIHTGGQNDAVALFGAKQGPDLPQPNPGGLVWDSTMQAKVAAFRILHSGYQVNVTSSTAQTSLYLADLDTTKNWSLTDNGSAIALNVSAQGLGRATLSGAGAHTLVLVAADTSKITLTKVVNKDTAHAGDSLTYTISYKNIGDKNATNVVISDLIPDHTTYVGGSASNSGTLSGGTLTWNLGTLAPGQSGSVSFVVTAN